MKPARGSFKKYVDRKDLEKAIGYKFKNPSNLTQALTHKSLRGVPNNEVLEQRGDAVLVYTVRNHLHDLHDTTEGDVARRSGYMLSNQTLAQIARKIGLDKHVLMSDSEERTGGRNKDIILARTLEAIIGGVLVDSRTKVKDSGRAPVVIKKLFGDMFHSNAHLYADPKTSFQEWAQKYRKHFEYKVTGQSGPDHSRRWTVELRISGMPNTSGAGSTKQAAEANAAEKFLRLHSIWPKERH